MLTTFTGVWGAILALFWIVYLLLILSNPHMRKELWGTCKGLLAATVVEFFLVALCVTLDNLGYTV